MAGFFSAYGMVAVLALLCVFFSWATYHREAPTGLARADSVAAVVIRTTPKTSNVVIVSQAGGADAEFSAALQSALRGAGYHILAGIQGDPPSVREAMEKLTASGKTVHIVATTESCCDWAVWNGLRSASPSFAKLRSSRRSARDAQRF
jgi:ribose transport system permease protein